MSTLILLTYVFFLHKNIAITCIYPILNHLSSSTSHTFKTVRSPQITRETNKKSYINNYLSPFSSFTTTKKASIEFTSMLAFSITLLFLYLLPLAYPSTLYSLNQE